jgi:hypothetical protein
MSATTRRAVLVGSGATVFAAVAVATASAAPPNPDAELIRICAQHVVNMDVLNSLEGWE